MKKPIYLRNVPPPYETFDHINFISFLISNIKPEIYLELGVSTGPTFQKCAEHSNKAIAVDILPRSFPIKENMEYHQCTTDEFFNNLDKNIIFDAVFIDADHSHEQSLKDFLNVKDRIIDDGFIFFHDTYPYDQHMMARHLCDDAYKTALYIKTHFIEEFEVLTLPFNPGVTILKKMPRNKQLLYL